MKDRLKYVLILLVVVCVVGIGFYMYKKDEFFKKGSGSKSMPAKTGYHRWSKGLGHTGYGGDYPSYGDIPFYASPTFLGVNQDCDKRCTESYKDCIQANNPKEMCNKTVGICLDKC